MSGHYHLFNLEVHREVEKKILDLVFSFESDNEDLIYSILWKHRNVWLSEGFFINLYYFDGSLIYHAGNGHEE